MAHRARVTHHVRGRIRLKLHGAKGNRQLLHAIQQKVAPMRGVKQVDVNPATGSVLVHYDAEHHEGFHERLAQHGESEGLFAIEAPELSEVDEMARKIRQEAEFLSAHSETARVIVDAVRSLNRQVKVATGNAVDLNVLLPLGLAIYSFVEVGVEASTPLWVTLGIFSFNSFITLHSHPPVRVDTQQVIVDRQIPEPAPAPPPPPQPAPAAPRAGKRPRKRA
jgi:cation transport ATPase